MQVFMKIPEDCIPNNATRDEIAYSLFNRVRNQFYQSATIKDVYLKDAHLYDQHDIYNGTLANEMSLIYGPENPDKIREIARGWNDNLNKQFSDALWNAITSLTDAEHIGVIRSCNWLNASRNAMYAVKKAAMALDGDFYDFADKVLFLDSYHGFTTVMDPTQLDIILAHPEDYAAIQVSPK